MELSIILPCLNEADSLAICLRKAHNFLKENGVDGEVIVADNGSSDESQKIAIENNALLVVELEKGYGNAITEGINASKGKYLIIGDADDSYDFNSLLPFLTLMREGTQLVIGNRFKGGIEKGAMPFLHKYLGNPLLSFMGRSFFNIRIGDFHCGLRGITRESYNKLDLRTTGMEFASEMIVKSALYKLKIAETPTILYKDKRNRPSHLRTWRDGWRHLRFLLLYSPGWIFLIPGIILMILGLTGTAILMAGPVQIGNKKLDVHTLVYTSSSILLGFQFISFYVFSRIYAAIHGLWPGQEKFLHRFEKYFTLEKGILAGAIIFLTGIYLTLKSVSYWQKTHFGNIDPVIVLRWVIPSALLLILGIQVIISFFYLSFLTLKSKQKRTV